MVNAKTKKDYIVNIARAIICILFPIVTVYLLFKLRFWGEGFVFYLERVTETIPYVALPVGLWFLFWTVFIVRELLLLIKIKYGKSKNDE